MEGIEISDEAITIGKKNGISYHVYPGSVLEMPYNSKIYDGIYCFNVLHLFKENDRNDFIQKCYKQLRNNGIVFFVVFSENEMTFGSGTKSEENTFESKPGRPVHYFTNDDIREHFNKFSIIDSGLIKDYENHGEEGSHTHILRYIIAQKKESHEFDGKKYRKASLHQKEWGTKIISEFKLHGNESILDLGCGDGTLTSLLSELVPKGKVIGIDASDGMISTAKEIETKKLVFKKMDIDEINFDEEFDLIFSNATLHWVKDHKKLLANCFKALKKNGSIRFNFAGEGNGSNFNNVIKETISHEKFKKYFVHLEWPWFMPSISEYKTLVTDCDFKNIEIWDENADRYFANENELIQWIEQPAIVPFLKLVANEDKDFFRSDVINKMIERTRQSDGRCFETFRRINVKATK